MCEKFYSRGNDSQADQRFQDWMAAHSKGYVFNHFTGSNPKYNLLHKLPCRAFTDNSPNTTYQKICCTDRACIERSIHQVRSAGGWEECGMGCCR